MAATLIKLGAIGILAITSVAAAACGASGPPDSPTATVSVIPTATADAELPFPPGDAAIGRETFDTTCAVCHGPAGNGAPGVAPGLESTWHAWEHPDRQIREWIAGGKLGLGRSMPAYGDRLDEQAISDAIEYVRTLWTQEQRDTQRDVSIRYEEGYRKYR